VPLSLHPWVYPPPFLLLLLPFGLPTPGISFALFMLAGFLAVLAATWFHAGDGHVRWLSVLSLYLYPAVPFNVTTGQNAFYTSALLLGGLGLSD
jgi:alpha-1,2-mannosyltransferase